MSSSEEVFFAVTPIEEFWDLTKPILFLGDWCMLYKRCSYLETLNSMLLSSPYENFDAAENAYLYVNDVYEKILPILGGALNSIHGKNYSSRYWRILIGPWLQLYLSVIYDRFLHIKHAQKQFPSFTLIGLSMENFVVPMDTLDFAYLMKEDGYNHQLFTKILSALGYDFPAKKYDVRRDNSNIKSPRGIWARKFVNYAVNIFANAISKSSKTILLKDSHFSKQIVLKLAYKSVGRIIPSWHKLNLRQQFECDIDKRSKLKAIEIGVGEFEKCLSVMLISDFPQCFIEGFSTVESDGFYNYPRHVHAIFSANGWYFDESFKQWAAMSADEGTLLLGTQHGGNYGSLKNMPSEDHETAIVDYYYSWGWGRTNCNAKVIPMPATKFAGRNRIGADNNKNGILWAATSAPRYAGQLPFLPTHFDEYLVWQNRFADAIPPEVMAEIRFRPHFENHSWGAIERLKHSVPDIQIDNWTTKFLTSLENCRLYVCDHLSTTFAEALAANKPTILFWNPETNRIRPEADYYFNILRHSGILFDTPEEAASAVAEAYQDVEAWWNESARQKSIRIFCDQFARTSIDTSALWWTELNRISGLSPLQ